jgi:DNA-binding MarR family transcriptional regulator
VGDPTDSIERSVEMLFRLNASRKVHARRAAAAGVVVSPPGFVLLRRIQEDGPLSLTDLSRLTEMDPAATGRQIRQLEHDGLVVRSTSDQDARVTVVRVTRHGAEVRRRLAEVGQAHMEGVLERWSKADRAALATLLARLVDDLRASQYQSINEERAG